MKLFVILLEILFIGLKLTNLIKWSWLWILSPLWIYGIFVICIIVYYAYLWNSLSPVEKLFYKLKHNK